MIPSAAITAVCGIGNTRSAQMRAMPTAHAQLSYCRSVRTTSLASWGVEITDHVPEASTSDRTPITIRPDLMWASECAGPLLPGSALGPTLQPAAHAGLVVAIGVAEAPLQVGLLARDDAQADRDGQRQRQDQDPRALCGYADAAVEEKHAEIDGIAGPAVNAGRHQRTRRLDREERRSCP